MAIGTLQVDRAGPLGHAEGRSECNIAGTLKIADARGMDAGTGMCSLGALCALVARARTLSCSCGHDSDEDGAVGNAMWRRIAHDREASQVIVIRV